MKRIELLDKSHNRTEFDCGNHALNQYLQQTARQHTQRGISRTFVLIDSSQATTIIGYFTLSICEIRSVKLPPNIAKKYPQTIAGIKLARLAVNKTYQRQGIGEILMIDAMKKAVNIAGLAGVIGLFVDAKDETAKNYYARYGFISLEDNDLSMFLPLPTIRQLLLEH